MKSFSMVQQMIDKFSEYKLVNSGAAMPTGDKQQSVSIKKVPLRGLNNDNRNIVTKPPGNSPLSEDRGSIADPLQVSGIKRHQPDCTPSPIHNQSTFNNGTNGHLVYVRRKLETEPSKVNACGDGDAAGSTKSRKFSNDEKKESNDQDRMLEHRVSCSPAFAHILAASQAISSGGSSFFLPPGRPVPGLVAEPIYSMATTGTPIQTNAHKTDILHWKERFLRLQNFLQTCDQSNLEEYMQMLRSLSAIGRSKHAYELEKRALCLLVEEGKELHRMRVLNVLGKASPNIHTFMSMPSHSPLQAVQDK